MNILFLSDNAALPTMGGVEKVVAILSEQFSTELGWDCHCAYFLGNSNCQDSGRIKIDLGDAERQLQSIIEKHQIDLILNNVMSKKVVQTVFPAISSIKSKNKNLKHIFTFHSCPGYELVHQDIAYLCKKNFTTHASFDSWKNMFIQILLRILPQNVSEKKICNKYKVMTQSVEKVVCLSGKQADRFAKFTNIPAEKLCSIPNPIALQNMGDTQTKKKNVLIVARLDETSKRISLALKVWHAIERNKAYDDWNLTIVGDGEDMPIYKKMASSLSLNRVSFEGRQIPTAYYASAAIFMMTSRFEGFPLTILEAQQAGAVVIGMYSNDFLTLPEVIVDNENGYIAHSKSEMIEKLQHLMENEELRLLMSQRAQKSVQEYDKKKTILKWKHLCEQQTSLI